MSTEDILDFLLEIEKAGHGDVIDLRTDAIKQIEQTVLRILD